MKKGSGKSFTLFILFSFLLTCSPSQRGEYLNYLLNNKEFLANKHPDTVCLLSEVHPTEEGYKRLAQNWFEALQLLIK